VTPGLISDLEIQRLEKIIWSLKAQRDGLMVVVAVLLAIMVSGLVK
jgi:hypothetical protein